MYIDRYCAEYLTSALIALSSIHILLCNVVKMKSRSGKDSTAYAHLSVRINGRRLLFPAFLPWNYKNSSGDVIANVLVNDDIAHT